MRLEPEKLITFSAAKKSMLLFSLDEYDILHVSSKLGFKYIGFISKILTLFSSINKLLASVIYSSLLIISLLLISIFAVEEKIALSLNVALFTSILHVNILSNDAVFTDIDRT